MKLDALAVCSCWLVACSGGSGASGPVSGERTVVAPAGPAASAATDPPWPVPAGWRTEVIPFPLDFAPSIAHRGQEVLRFPPGFFDPAAGGYWSYAFVWRTDDPAQLDAAALGAELTAYFRGLIAAVDEKGRISAQARDEIIARASADGPARFRLAAHVVDAFKTAAPINLEGWAERRACRAGALWVFVLAPTASAIRPQLEALAGAARCAP